MIGPFCILVGLALALCACKSAREGRARRDPSSLEGGRCPASGSAHRGAASSEDLWTAALRVSRVICVRYLLVSWPRSSEGQSSGFLNRIHLPNHVQRNPLGPASPAQRVAPGEYRFGQRAVICVRCSCSPAPYVAAAAAAAPGSSTRTTMSVMSSPASAPARWARTPARMRSVTCSELRSCGSAATSACRRSSP